MKTLFRTSRVESATPPKQYDSQLQAARQQNIKAALELDDLTSRDLVTLYNVARAGINLAYAFDKDELDDRTTFFGQQVEIRDRLARRPTAEVLAAVVSQAEVEIS